MKLFGKKSKDISPVATKKNDKQQKVVSASSETKKSKSKPVALATVSRSVIQPLLTEKAGMLEAKGQYVFLITKFANKSEVKKEIERFFNVKVASVNIINKKRKKRMWRGRVGFSPGLKKAIITLQEGDKIEVLPK